MKCANGCGEDIRKARDDDRVDPRDYEWVHEGGNPICDGTLVATPSGPPQVVHIIVAQGHGAPQGSLLYRANLEIEAVFKDAGDAERWSTMGDMEVQEMPVTPPGEDPY